MASRAYTTNRVDIKVTQRVDLLLCKFANVLGRVGLERR